MTTNKVVQLTARLSAVYLVGSHLQGVYLERFRQVYRKLRPLNRRKLEWGNSVKEAQNEQLKRPLLSLTVC